MKQIKRKAAKTAFGCLMLLLLYGCASRASGFYGGEAEGTAPDREAEADFSWAADGSERAMDAADGSVGAASEESREMSEQTAGQPPDGSAEDVSPEMIAVYVCGAVEAPGVYELAAGSRVYEAVALAGGMTEEAWERGLNQAEVLSDGQMIVVLTEEEAEEQTGNDEAVNARNEDGLVNINAAGAEELKTLPGIGDAKAAAIIAYREKNGAFAAISDLKKVSGIGEGVFARLEGLIKAD